MSSIKNSNELLNRNGSTIARYLSFDSTTIVCIVAYNKPTFEYIIQLMLNKSISYSTFQGVILISLEDEDKIFLSSVNSENDDDLPF